MSMPRDPLSQNPPMHAVTTVVSKLDSQTCKRLLRTNKHSLIHSLEIQGLKKDNSFSNYLNAEFFSYYLQHVWKSKYRQAYRRALLQLLRYDWTITV